MKPISFTIFFVLTYCIAFSQSRIHSNFGIKAGATAAKFGQEQINWDTKYRWHAGLLAHLHISDHFAIQPELFYSAQGSEHVIVGSNTQIELGYLQLPVLFQYMTGSGFRFQGGPQIGLLLNAKQQLNGGPKTDVKDSFKKTDFSLTAGISYITRMGLGFDARYSYGFSDISKTDNSSGADINNLLIQVGAFYQFKHK